MKICKNNHRYDETQYSSCPYCPPANNSDTVALGNRAPVASQPVNTDNGRSYAGTFDRNFRSEGYLDQYLKDDANKGTVNVYKKEKGFDPVVGWLVCIEGASKGLDFKIKAERNFIGSDESMDICIMGDNSISANKHAIISYNPKELTFRLYPGESHGIVYVNNKEVYAAEELKHGDTIQIGQTTLLFVPLCNEKFSW